jgi:uncharacterized protein YfdQ (DUF2303 family)
MAGEETKMGDAQAQIEIARRFAQVLPVEGVDGLSIAILPGNEIMGAFEKEVLDLEQYLAHPRRKTGVVLVRDIESFTTYVNRHATAATVIFYDEGGDATAIFDHHEPVEAQSRAGWGRFQARLERPYTPQFAAWKAANGKWFKQRDFALFLEDRIAEISEPPGADLLELAQKFRASKSISFRSEKRLSDGQTQIEYIEEIEGSSGATSKLVMPESISVVVRPYQDSPAMTFRARLRWTLQDAAVAFSIVLPESVADDLRSIHEAAIADIASELTRDDVPLLWGKP